MCTQICLIWFFSCQSKRIYPIIEECSEFEFIAAYEGDIPGASAVECGNYQEQNLNMAHYYAKKYLAALENPCLHYPD